MRSPDPPPIRTSPRRFQFRLSYLLYLLTLFAFGFALLRTILGFRGGWLVTTLGSIYVAALVAYFAIRFPILVRRVRGSARNLAARQQELAELAAAARRQEADPKENS